MMGTGFAVNNFGDIAVVVGHALTGAWSLTAAPPPRPAPAPVAVHAAETSVPPERIYVRVVAGKTLFWPEHSAATRK